MFYLLPMPINLSPGGIRLPVPARGSKLWRDSGEAEEREDNAENERNREKERGWEKSDLLA